MGADRPPKGTAEVLVVRKTHLDVGFTDGAATVRRRYLDELVPAALATARRLRERGEGDGSRLVWTVGSWLVEEALAHGDRSARRAVEEAVLAGDLVWHALPFTIHTELADPSLLRAALAVSARLDERFGRTTRAAKATDVPGHTRGLVPLLVEAGVGLLHIGVNPASTPPDVPPVFRWREPTTGAEVVVVYQRGGYGGAQALPGTATTLVVDHTGDNIGPPTEADVRSLDVELRGRHPGAVVRPGTLDDALSALEAAGAVDGLPVVEAELGDTWIHGAATDPVKLARFRALCRWRTQALEAGALVPGTPVDVAAARALLLTAEHTWGLDEKVHWPDRTTWSARALAEARRSDPRVAALEASWAEQRAYVEAAAEALATGATGRPGGAGEGADADDGDPIRPARGTGFAVPRRWGSAGAAELDGGRPSVQDVLDATVARRPSLEGLTLLAAGEAVQGRHATVAVDPGTGALTTCVVDGRDLADERHPLGWFRYRTHDTGDYDRWWRQYVVATPEDEWWAREDQTKPGLEDAGVVSRWWPPVVVGSWSGRHEDPRGPGTRVVVRLAGAAEAVERFGCPPEVWLVVDLPDDRAEVRLDLRWFDKPATRVPESSWFVLHPSVGDPAGWRLDKLGVPVAPDDVVDDGGGALHGIGRGVAHLGRDPEDVGAGGPATLGSLAARRGHGCTIESLDAALVAPGRPSLLRHTPRPAPDPGRYGVAFCLHDNVWGTNFPMWSEGDARFRFVLRPEAPDWWTSPAA